MPTRGKGGGREALERPYRREFEQSEMRRADVAARMPKTLEGLLAWFAEAITLELPESMHTTDTVWAIHERRVTVDRDGGIKRQRVETIVRGLCSDAADGRACTHVTTDGPIHPNGGGESIPVHAGGSVIGSPEETGPFRALLYGSPAQTDEEGSYLRPIHRAISELERTGRPLMARMLFALAASGYDWKAIGERGHWAEEQFADYLEWALRKLWNLTIPRDERKVRIS